MDRSLVLLHQTLLEHLYRAATAARHAFLPLHLPLTAATSPYAVAFNTVTRAHLVKSKHMLVRIRAKNHRADLEQQRRRGSASAGETGDDYTAGETVDDEMEDECFETFAGTARMATTRRGDDNGDGITDGGFLRVHASSLSQSDLDVPSPSLPVSMQETLLHADQYVIRRARWSAETGGGSLES